MKHQHSMGLTAGRSLFDVRHHREWAFQDEGVLRSVTSSENAFSGPFCTSPGKWLFLLQNLFFRSCWMM